MTSLPRRGGDNRRGVNPQLSEVSDTDDTTADTPWWGRIVERGGRRVRVVPGAVPERDPELDWDLEEGDTETLEEAVDRMDQDGVPYAEIVRRVMADYEVSESTAKRRIRESRQARAA
ncbi:hypothetical protein GCM10027605_68550 [Micromonospora zhanjiangensis]